MALTETQQALADLMSEISQYCWFAGWLAGSEYRLWQFMIDTNDHATWGNYPIPPEYREQLRQLSELVGGWIHWRDGPEIPIQQQGEAFVELNEWKAMFATWGKAHAGAEALPRRYADYVAQFTGHAKDPEEKND